MMGQLWKLDVEGMSCNGCVNKVKAALESMDGVESAEVSLEDKAALVRGQIGPQVLMEAIRSVGKQASLRDRDAFVLRIDGMTCNGCVKKVKEALENVLDVAQVEVSLENKCARIWGCRDPRMLIDAVSKVGKRAFLAERSAPERLVALRVTKMPCNGCKAKVTKALQTVSGVASVFVSLAEQLVIVSGEADTESLVEAVKGAGKVPELLHCTSEDTVLTAYKVDGVDEEKRAMVASSLESLILVRETYFRPEEGFLLVVGSGPTADNVQKVLKTCSVAYDNLLPRQADTAGKSGSQAGADGVQTLTKNGENAKLGGETKAANETAVEKPVSVFLELADEFVEEDTGEQNLHRDLQMQVKGMTCSSCVGIVEGVLKELEGVVAAKVNLLASRATVKYNFKLVAPEAIVDAVNKSGYRAEALQSSDGHRIFFWFQNAKTAEEAKYAVENKFAEVRCKVERCEKSSTRSFSPWAFSRSMEEIYLSVEFLHPDKDMQRPGIFQDIYKELAAKYAGRGFELVQGYNPLLSKEENPSQVLAASARKYLALFTASFCFLLPILLLKLMLHRQNKAMGMREEILVAFFATIVQFGCGWTFYRGAFYALKRRRANMDTLVALGSSVAYFFSYALMLYAYTFPDAPRHRTIFETGALLITIVLFGKWLESLAKRRAADGVSALERLRPETTTYMREEDGKYYKYLEDASVDLALPGDLIQVKPGERCSVDGVIVLGSSSVNEAMLTGEATHRSKGIGDQVFAGTTNCNNMLVVKATAVSSNTLLSRVAALVDEAQTSRAKVESFADAVSAIFVPTIVSLSLATTCVWLVLTYSGIVPAAWYAGDGKVLFSVTFGLAVLVVACPCALGLATPTVVMVATGLAAHHGVLFKGGGASLESADKILHVLFDKTGTITKGTPFVTGSKPLHSEFDLKDAYEVIASVEASSNHPLAKAITQHIREKLGYHHEQALQWSDTSEGRGVKAALADGRRVDVGSAKWISENCGLQPDLWWRESQGQTVVVAAIDSVPVLLFELDDEIRPEARQAISYLQDRMGISVHMVTGDNATVANRVAAATNIPQENVVANAMPWTKIERVRELMGSGYTVSFVGDGINDAPALAAADVGIAIGAGTQVAVDTASVVLVRSSLEDAVVALDISRRAFKTIRLNFIWALGYNLLAVPVAAGFFYPLVHMRLPPLVAASMMALSSISIVLTSLMLRTYRRPNMQSTARPWSPPLYDHTGYNPEGYRQV